MFWDIYKLYPGQHDFLPAQSNLNMSLHDSKRVFFFRSSDNIQGKQDSMKFRVEDACCTRQPNKWHTTFMEQGFRNSVAHFRTVGIDMIEIF